MRLSLQPIRALFSPPPPSPSNGPIAVLLEDIASRTTDLATRAELLGLVAHVRQRGDELQLLESWIEGARQVRDQPKAEYPSLFVNGRGWVFPDGRFVPMDGDIAHRAGFSRDDNPFPLPQMLAGWLRWDSDWRFRERHMQTELELASGRAADWDALPEQTRRQLADLGAAVVAGAAGVSAQPGA